MTFYVDFLLFTLDFESNKKQILWLKMWYSSSPLIRPLSPYATPHPTFWIIMSDFRCTERQYNTTHLSPQERPPSYKANFSLQKSVAFALIRGGKPYNNKYHWTPNVTTKMYLYFPSTFMDVVFRQFWNSFLLLIYISYIDSKQPLMIKRNLMLLFWKLSYRYL